jgi:PEP-CTERM motif
MTVNGITNSFVPDFAGQIIAVNGQPNIVNEIFDLAEAPNYVVELYMENVFSQISGSIPGTIDVPLTYTLGPNDTGGGSASLGGEGFGLSAVTVTYTIPSIAPGVPEPSTWAGMLIGFVGLGYAGFRRRRSAFAVT